MATRVPRTLYHYCSVNTFFSILKNRSLWLSDVSKTNDSLELKWIIGQFRLFLLDTWINYVKSAENRGQISSKDFDTIHEIDDILNYLSQTEISKAWVFCLTELADHLGQWRGYADDGRGLAIGFDPKLFQIMDQCYAQENLSFDFCFHKIGYGEKAAKTYFEGLLKQMEITPQTSSIDVIQKLQRAAIITKDAAPWFKNEGFNVEKEWRLIYRKNIGRLLSGELPSIPPELEAFSELVSIGNMGYTPKSNNLVSHVEFKIDSIDKIIRKIIIGPKCELTKEEILLFLISCGIIKNKEECKIEISKSSASYR